MSIPADLLALDRWVCADEGTKAPLDAVGHFPASVSDPASWTSFDGALQALKRQEHDYLGFVFCKRDHFVGIDLDHAIGEGGELSELAASFLEATTSYTEVSKSGRGLHIILRGTSTTTGNTHRGLEVYTDKHYFILTGEVVGDRSEILPVTDEVAALIAQGFAIQEHTVREGGPIAAPIWPEVSAHAIPLMPKFPTLGEGVRHMGLLSIGGQLVSWGNPMWWVKETLYALNRELCWPPMKASEVAQIIRSIEKYGGER